LTSAFLAERSISKVCRLKRKQESDGAVLKRLQENTLSSAALRSEANITSLQKENRLFQERIERQLEGLDSEMIKLQKRNSSLEEQLTKLVSEVDSLKKQNQSLEERLVEMENKKPLFGAGARKVRRRL